MKKERLFLALLGLIVLMVVILGLSLGWRPDFLDFSPSIIRYTGFYVDNGNPIQEVNGCGELNTTNAVYTLNQTIDSAETCFTITANNITLNMDGYNMNGDASGPDLEYGIVIDGYNDTTILNGNISNFTAGIRSLNNYGLNISGGIYIENGPDDDASNDNDGYNIYLYNSHNYNIKNLESSKPSHSFVVMCFLPGTEITMADGSYKNIEDIEMGDKVKYYDFEESKVKDSSVTAIKTPYHDDIVEFVFENGVRTKHTYDHPYYVVGKGWASFRPEWTKERYNLDTVRIEIGDVVKTETSTTVLKEINVLNMNKTKTYIFGINQTEINNQNFFADGILVHNKPCAFLFSEEDDKTELEWHIFGVYSETGDYDSELLDLRNIKEKQGYSYLNLVHETNKFELVELPYEIDFIDFIELKVVDTPVYPFNLILKEKVYHLKLVDASQGLELMQEPDEQYFNLTSTQRISITFEELPEKNTFYKRNLVFVAKGWYEFYQGATLLGDWLYEEPYKDEKMIKHFEQKHRRDEIVEIYRTTIKKMGGREGILPYPYEEDYNYEEISEGGKYHNTQYGIYAENSNYGEISNITGNGTDSSDLGIYLKASNYTMIENCNFIDWTNGIGLGSSSANNTIINNTFYSSNTGIQCLESLNNNITNNTVTLANSAIYLSTCSNNIITGNIVNSNTNGFYIYESSNDNILINNTANSNSGAGIYLRESSYNTITNTIINLNQNEGIYLYRAPYNTIINLSSPNCGVSNVACIFVKTSNGNYFENIYLNDITSGAKGIEILSQASGGCSNNLFKNVTIENIADDEVYIIRTEGSALNNTFVNSNYNLNKEVVTGANTELIRKWYLDVVVSNRGVYLEDANVTGFNVSDVKSFSELTVGGSIGRQELVEYSNLNGVRTYATPHTINITKSGYETNSTTYNLTLEQNVNHLVELVANETSPLEPSKTSSGGSTTITLSQEQVEEGYSKLFREDQKVRLTINEQIHTVAINFVDGENKKVEIELEEIGEVIELSENETKKIDLNNDGYYDVQILVKEIGVNNYADLEFKEIHEEIPAEEQEKQESPSKIEKEIKDWMWIVGCLIGLIVVGVVVRRVLVKNKR